MTEPRRATWREFVEWLRRKRSDKDGELKRVAPEVQTRGEAALVCRFVLGLGRTSTGHCVDEWFDALRSQGIEPPADPTSVAEVLESAAAEFEQRASHVEDDADDPRRAGKIDGFYSAIERVAGLRGKSAGLMEAAAALRANAKEFT